MRNAEKSIAEKRDACRELLLQRQEVLSLAESCTGGWISKYITDQPGSSAYYWGGVCCYANAAKEALLQVPPEHLAAFGAVSETVAWDMASGIMRLSGSDYSVAVTGIAGPDGGTADKPVGLVYIAVASRTGIAVRECHFAGDREAVRLQTVAAALDMILERIEKNL